MNRPAFAHRGFPPRDPHIPGPYNNLRKLISSLSKEAPSTDNYHSIEAFQGCYKEG